MYTIKRYAGIQSTANGYNLCMVIGDAENSHISRTLEIPCTGLSKLYAGGVGNGLLRRLPDIEVDFNSYRLLLDIPNGAGIKPSEEWAD